MSGDWEQIITVLSELSANKERSADEIRERLRELLEVINNMVQEKPD